MGIYFYALLGRFLPSFPQFVSQLFQLAHTVVNPRLAHRRVHHFTKFLGLRPGFPNAVKRPLSGAGAIYPAPGHPDKPDVFRLSHGCSHSLVQIGCLAVYQAINLVSHALDYSGIFKIQ